MSRRRLTRGERQHLLRLARYMAIRARLERASPAVALRQVPGRDGKPTTFAEWAARFEAFPDARRVRQDRLPSGAWVSTVWLGPAYSILGGAFETMVFRSRRHLEDLDACRYRTEDEAKRGHMEMVARWWSLPLPAP